MARWGARLPELEPRVFFCYDWGVTEYRDSDALFPSRTVQELEILYVGQVAAGLATTAYQRMLALRELGHHVVPLDATWPGGASRAGRLLLRLERKLWHNMRDGALDQQMQEAVASTPIDVLWIDKGLTIAPATLEHARQTRPSIRIVGYSPDDMMNPGNQSRQFLKCLPFYDVFFTTKSYQVEELHALGCRRAVFVENAFAPQVHRPVPLSPDERRMLGGPVGFIGTPERDRALSLAFLAAHDIPVKIWGNGWNRWRKRLNARFVVGGIAYYGERYARTICAFDINLGFLRKVNRDLQTTRSMEIPACGAFMLAERTEEHLSLFEEGQEAEFFEGNEEMLDKVRFYLAHPELRARIAAAGRERCLRSGYSNHDRLRQMLRIVMDN